MKNNFNLEHDIEIFTQEIGESALPLLLEVIKSNFNSSLVCDLIFKLGDDSTYHNFAEEKHYISAEFRKIATEINNWIEEWKENDW